MVVQYIQKQLGGRENSLALSLTTLESNSAMNGGSLYLSRCYLSLLNSDRIEYSKADKGGAIYAEDLSVIFIGNSGVHTTIVTLANNTAQDSGGGLFLVDSYLRNVFSTNSLIFDHNTAADKGGAMYVLENKCEEVLNITPCFINLGKNWGEDVLTFLNNDAGHGSILYGGLLDRCHTQLVGLEWLGIYAWRYDRPPMTSDPIRVCLCVEDMPHCGTNDIQITMLRGQAFKPVVAAVDQGENAVSASILAQYTKISAELGKGEGRQLVHGYCTELTYHIYTKASMAMLVLRPEGMCERLLFSKITVHITVQNCTTGFEQLEDRCVCDRRLLKYLNNVTCSVDTLTVIRKGSSWFRYDEEHLKMHTNCPLDYCRASSDAISFSSPDEHVPIIAGESYVVRVKTITALLWEAPNVYTVPPDTLSFG